jgi:hypothetical protein
VTTEIRNETIAPWQRAERLGERFNEEGINGVDRDLNSPWYGRKIARPTGLLVETGGRFGFTHPGCTSRLDRAPCNHRDNTTCKEYHLHATTCSWRSLEKSSASPIREAFARNPTAFTLTSLAEATNMLEDSNSIFHHNLESAGEYDFAAFSDDEGYLTDVSLDELRAAALITRQYLTDAAKALDTIEAVREQSVELLKQESPDDQRNSDPLIAMLEDMSSTIAKIADLVRERYTLRY